MKSNLEEAIEKLDIKINILDMQINSTRFNGKTNWPGREDWRTFMAMSQKVVDEYWKEKENG